MSCPHQLLKPPIQGSPMAECKLTTKIIGWVHGFPAAICERCSGEPDDPVVADRIKRLAQGAVARGGGGEDRTDLAKYVRLCLKHDVPAGHVMKLLEKAVEDEQGQLTADTAAKVAAECGLSVDE